MRAMPLVLAAALSLLLPAAPPAFAQDSPEQSALAAALQWLQTVDQAGYAASWTEAAAYFQKAVPQGEWVQAMEAARAPLGALASRKLLGMQFAESLPGAPDGEYVVIRFHTAFANKQSAEETVTPMRDPDGAWRVSGYFIR